MISNYEIIQNTPQKGDILYVKRTLYSHYGIYVGDGKVIHFAANAGAETNASKADIHETTVWDFLKGGKLFVLKDPVGLKPFPADVIVQRAKSKLDKCKGEYNLVSNNCEHFAFWCRYGEPYSHQVENVADFIASLLMIPVVLLQIASGENLVPKIEHRYTTTLRKVSLADIVVYFKRQENINLLQTNRNYIAVCLKKSNFSKIELTYGIYDSKKSEIVKFETCFAEELDEELKQLFNDRDMIIIN